jgi:hypothetical protein
MKYNIIHDKIKCTSHLSFGKIDSMVVFYYIGRIMRIPQVFFLRGVDRYYKQIKIDGGRI